MNTDTESFSSLADLESFDARVFKQDKQVSQEVCNFFLGLACICNDHRDILLAFHELEILKPLERGAPSPELGEYNGIHFHLVRVHVSLINELVKFISNEETKIKTHNSYKAVIKALNKSNRKIWNALLDASSAKSRTSLHKSLRFVRNKISFHYDPKAIYEGYKQKFLDSNQNRPYISKGKSLENIRFYFAEASAQGYFLKICPEAGNSYTEIKELANSMGDAISHIVRYFIELRIKHIAALNN